ncbi:unnamed protein product [Haemonchus placei]|uniref:Lectin_legB domain-containing protein n=1 Tax=Haemonchus placei TaxID=6290 RepID=A0A0N4W6R7_HAEPC|nr:unnamed protein product [Haemonchus placei]
MSAYCYLGFKGKWSSTINVRVFFSVDEKTDKEPSIVPKYNFSVCYSAYLSILVHSKVSVLKDWVVAARSLSRYAPSSPPSTKYSGYTGGAMFVLGVFSLLLGVAIGAGGVFFVTKRQRISTLAYQVFE